MHTKMKNNTIQESFHVNLRIMKILGLYPPDKITFLYKMQAYFMYFLFLICSIILTIVNLTYEENIDITQLNHIGIALSESICYVGKLLPFIKNHEEIKKCLYFFEDSFFTVEKEPQQKILNRCKRICQRNSMCYLIFISVAVVGWDILPFFVRNGRLPLDVWLPNAAKSGPLYWIFYTYTAFAASYIAFSGMIIDPLIGGLVCQAGGQMKVLKYNLQNLSTNVLKAHEEIAKCIAHHRAILHFAKLFEENFSWIIFCQFVAAAFAICFSFLQLRSEPLLSLNGLTSTVFVMIVPVQVYFYCYYGTELMEENRTLANAIYMGQWYELDLKSKKTLLVIMERSKKPLIVSAGKIVEMSLDTFTGILKKSYSLICVFNK